MYINENRYSLCPKTFPQNTSGSLKQADKLELHDLLQSRRFRTSIETRGSLLKGVPQTLAGKKDGRLALENFPDNFHLLFLHVMIFSLFLLFRCESLGILK